MAGNKDYRSYLNKYGDSKFCNYKIDSHLKDKGIYCYIVDEQIMYIGRCRKNFNLRINCDYGNITAYNSLIGGQATNCHINSIINEVSKEKTVSVGIFSMIDKSNEEIVDTEKLILKTYSFPWNIQTS
ncbi:MAG: hypothetical protein EOO44_09065 [Flavobacterium sp.]|nr:MAG: hypothetical protein EOO44_09065 [Flavobacterium sp.]